MTHRRSVLLLGCLHLLAAFILVAVSSPAVKTAQDAVTHAARQATQIAAQEQQLAFLRAAPPPLAARLWQQLARTGPVDPAALPVVIQEVARQEGVTDIIYTLSPESPLMLADGNSLRPFRMTLRFSSVLDTNIVIFLQRLEEALPGILIVQGLEIAQARTPDASDTDMLRQGEIPPLFNGTLAAVVLVYEHAADLDQDRP